MKTATGLAAGILLVWGLAPCRAEPRPIKYDTPTQLARIPVASQPFALAWSADGAYLAAATSYTDPSTVYILDVAKTSVTHPLKSPGWAASLAFSPDGKWLAVGSREPIGPGATPAELIVFDVPAFTKRFSMKSEARESRFFDLAWSPDSKALCALEGPTPGAGKAQVRRWTVPEFAEQSPNRSPQDGQYLALAVSPDGLTLAVADQPSAVATRWVRLFDPGKGAERSKFKFDGAFERLAFAADGKALAVYGFGQLTWCDVSTGRPVKPNSVRVAIQPAGLADQRGHYASAADGAKHAQASAEYPKFIFEGGGQPKNKYGAFVRVTDGATGKTLTWRVGEASGTTDTPVIAFSPDTTKLAGAVRDARGNAVIVWASPK